MNTRFSRRSFIAGAGALPLMAACSPLGSDRASHGADEVVLWYWNRSIDPQAFRDYEQANPGITIDAQLVGGAYASRLNTVLAGRTNIPDVAALNNDISRYFPDQNRFVNLYDMGAGDVQDQYLDWKWKAGETTDGNLLGFPIDTGPLVLYYRADMFEAAGLPSDPAEVTKLFATWEDYFATAPDIASANPGATLADNVQYIYLMALMQSQEFYVNANDEFIGDGPSVRRAWDTMLAARDAQIGSNILPFSPEWSAGVEESAFASFVGASWMKQFLMESGNATAGKWRVAQTPGGPGNQGGSFISITDAAVDKERSWSVIQQTMDPEHQTAQYKSLALFPSALASLDDPVMEEEEDYFGGQPTGLEFVTTARDLKPFYFSPTYPVAHSIMDQEVTKVINAGKDPARAWDDGQKQMRREIKHKAPTVTFPDREEN